MPTSRDGEKHVVIRRARVGELTLYEITDHELDGLEKGGTASQYLNFAIFLISTGLSFLVALLTSDIESPRTFVVFVVVVAVGLCIGLFLLIGWHQRRGETTELITRIKSRMPERPEREPVPKG